MKEYPILFSGEMVQAILDGRKTQTRRVINPQSLLDNKTRVAACYECPYGAPGDLLWVRETHWIDWYPSGVYDNDGNAGVVHYRASTQWDVIAKSIDAHWRPSIFMPRWASRILLEVTDIQVERVQNINDEDARKEGIQDVCHCGDYVESHGYHSGHGAVSMPGWATENFSSLWDSINAKRGHSWESNPWVWVVGFKVVKP